MKPLRINELHSTYQWRTNMTETKISGITMELISRDTSGLRRPMRICLEREDLDMNRKGKWLLSVSGVQEVTLTGDQLNYLFKMLNKTVDGEIS
jgi:hypothetical protein